MEEIIAEVNLARQSVVFDTIPCLFRFIDHHLELHPWSTFYNLSNEKKTMFSLQMKCIAKKTKQLEELR